MATLRTYLTTEYSPRRKLRYFQFAMLRAARVALANGDINSTQFNTILDLYKRPWRKAGTASYEQTASIVARGANYIVGDVLTVTATSAKFQVARVNNTGGVTQVVLVKAGSSAALTVAGATTVNRAGGTGCTLTVVPSVTPLVDVLDQVRIDLQKAWNITRGDGLTTTIKDWGTTTLLSWLESHGSNGALGSVGLATWSNVAFNIGDLVVSSAVTYYSKTAHTTNTAPAGDATGWVAVTNAMGVILASIAARKAALTTE